jgi:hypothetical protein
VIDASARPSSPRLANRLDQQHSVGVGIVTTEPGGIEADDVDRKLPTEKQYELPRSEFRWLDHGALQLVLDPRIVLLPLEDGAFPGVLEAKRGRMTHAIHPA